MPPRPFLLFPKASGPAKRSALGGGGGAVQTPSAARQRERLDARFRQIADSFQTLHPTAVGTEPEQVIVFETVGDSVAGFAAAAARVPGLEWLAELDLDDRDPDDDFRDADDPARRLPQRLYAVMSSQHAMQQLLSLWGQWAADPGRRARHGFGPFKEVFTHLRDVRRWGPGDRLLETGVLEDWEANLTFGRDRVRFEVELWCRGDDAARRRAYAHLERVVNAAGGRCVAQAAVPEILYHGVLAELPAAALRDTVERIRRQEYTELLRCEEVMFFRPRAQAAFPVGEPAAGAMPGHRAGLPAAAGEPFVAVLDGLPLENHEALRGRVRVDDPDDHAARYAPRQQEHGTAMCSLVAHGDLNRDEPPLGRPVYVRPVLVPEEDFDGNVREVTPDGVLLVDLFHRAVRRVLEGDGGAPAAAPSVRVVNLSFGNTHQPFDRQFSPLARLLDWLAWKYRVLFLVSAGNQGRDITIAAADTDWRALSEEELRNQVLAAMHRDQAFRRPYSPAESVNAVTVGAWHADGFEGDWADRRVDLLKGASVPSPLATVAAGHKRAVKPEVFFPGGRQLYHGPHLERGEPARFRVATSSRPPGLLVAAPGQAAMELGRTTFSRGTSNATALASRCAGRAAERLAELRREPGWERLTPEYLGVLLKALLVHGACWGAGAGHVGAAAQAAGPADARELQRVLNRFLGCGEVQAGRAWSAADGRATVLAWDELGDDEAHVYRLPLPACLNAVKEWRRLTVTLAWFTPVNPRHKNYRKAFLWATVGEDERGKLRVEKAGLDVKTSQRGTVQHLVFEGEKATAYAEDEALVLKVNCKADAGKLTERVPYALAVSIEVAEGVALPVYDQIELGLRVQVPPVRPPA